MADFPMSTSCTTNRVSKQRSYTAADKLAIYEDYKKSGLSVRNFVAVADVSKSVMQRIIKTHKSLKSSLQDQTVSPSRIRLRDSHYTDIDEALLTWYQNTRSENLQPLSGSIIRTRAEKLASDLGHSDWKCSTGWLRRWQARYQISFQV